MTGFQQARPYDTGVAPFNPNEVLQAGQRTQLGALGLQLERIKAQRATESYELQKQVMASMSPKERLAFSFSPEQSGGALAKMLYPENKNYAVSKEGALVGPTGQLLYQSPAAAGAGVTWQPGAGAGSNLQNAMPPPPPQQQASITSTPLPPPTPAPGPQPSYPDIIKNRENRTGNPAAKNPNSTATGDHQFIASTWLDMIKTHRPWLAEGKTDKEILALRDQPGLSAEMAQSYADDNAPLLKQAGFETSITNLAILHGFGPTGGMKILQAERANPNTPLASVLSPQALKNHPELRGLTIAQGRQLLERQLAGGQAGAAPPQAAAPPPQATPAPAPTPAPAQTSGNEGSRSANAGGWETATKGGAPYGTGAKPGTYWQRRQTGVDAQGKPTYEYRTAPADGEGKGPFEGNAPKSQAYNIVTDYQTRLAAGEQLTDRDRFIYELAVRELTEPTTVQGTDNLIRRVPQVPLPQFGGGAPGSAQAAPAAPPQVETIAPATPKPNDEQNKNAGFARRLSSSIGVFDQLEASGYEGPSEMQRQLTDKVPGFNRLVSAEGQQYLQAARDFINAQLRRESGAVISPDEFTNAYAQYLPVPGDKPPTLALKRRARELALKNMSQSSGVALKAGDVPTPPDQLPPVEQRVVGQTYQTPSGPAIWRGSGWELVAQTPTPAPTPAPTP